MGTVSAGGDLDLNAVINGGPDFVQRLAEFQTAAAAHKKAYDDLNLGKAAVAAHDEAHRILAQAKERALSEAAKIEQEMANARAAMETWKAQAQKDTQAHLDAAAAQRTEVDKRMALAKEAHAQAADALTRAQAKADEIVNAANKTASSKLADANAVLSKAQADADAKTKAADARMAEALALKAKVTEGMSQLKSLVG